MAEGEKHPLTFKEFRSHMARELEIDEALLTREATFYDLMVDSIRMVEMLLHFEEQGVEIPLEMAWQIETIGDAYEVYRESAAASSRPAEAWRMEAKHVGE